MIVVSSYKIEGGDLGPVDVTVLLHLLQLTCQHVKKTDEFSLAINDSCYKI